VTPLLLRTDDAACTMACAWKQRQASEKTTKTLFDGRTVCLNVHVNTDEDPAEVAERVRKAAAGPHTRMVVVSAGLVTGDAGSNFWESIRGQVKKQRGRN